MMSLKHHKVCSRRITDEHRLAYNMDSSWFIPSASSCLWYDDDNAKAEDILAQAWKFDLHGRVYSNTGTDDESEKEKRESR